LRILFSSYAFSPSVGGIESVSATLAAEFTRAGHEIQLVTETSSDDALRWPFPVFRRPTAGKLWQATRWCDVALHNNISLSLGWPLLAVRRPWVIAHQTWISRPNGTISGLDRLKTALLRCATNIAISEAIATALPVNSAVIGNPYDAGSFKRMPDIERSKDLIFVGRLVSDKGVDLLLEALAALQQEGLRPELTIVGNGPEEESLRGLAERLGIAEQVTFSGTKRGDGLVRELNRHRVLVVPSRWKEPFGVVALEGIACGCVVVGSTGGGLPDAIGPCGLTFPSGEPLALAAVLHRVLTDEALCAGLLQNAAFHLEAHRPDRVAGQYLKILEAAVR